MMFGNDWDILLKDEFQKEYFIKLKDFLVQERANYTVFPPKDEVFSALRHTSYQDVKVVILGQDPYHGEGQAHGLAFSVKPGVEAPPSLVNIHKELQSDLGIPIPNHGSLIPWAKQGVLLPIAEKDGRFSRIVSFRFLTNVKTQWCFCFGDGMRQRRKNL